MKARMLIVEDREENRQAAQKFFDTKADIDIDFARTYHEAIEKMYGHVYAAAIIDLEIPREEGGEPDKEFGLDLSDRMDSLDRYRIPKVILTGGYKRHDQPVSKVFLDRSGYEAGAGTDAGAKGSPESWKRAYEVLLEICPESVMWQMGSAKERVLGSR